MRSMMDRVRTQERIIMKLCVEQCKMPKKNFITLFTGNETSETWFNAAVAMNKRFNHLFLRTTGFRFADGHATVDIFNLLDGQAGLFFNLLQLLQAALHIFHEAVR